LIVIEREKKTNVYLSVGSRFYKNEWLMWEEEEGKKRNVRINDS
jgi:hypothetical protein